MERVDDPAIRSVGRRRSRARREQDQSDQRSPPRQPHAARPGTTSGITRPVVRRSHATHQHRAATFSHGRNGKSRRGNRPFRNSRQAMREIQRPRDARRRPGIARKFRCFLHPPAGQDVERLEEEHRLDDARDREPRRDRDAPGARVRARGCFPSGPGRARTRHATAGRSRRRLGPRDSSGGPRP